MTTPMLKEQPSLRTGDLLDADEKNLELLQALDSYRHEAEQNRLGGPNPRDAKWTQNLDLYWNRHDFSHKADWQAKETMPEVPAFVDRFAAALKEALVATHENFYTVTDPSDEDGAISNVIKKITDAWLSTCGRNQNGHPLGFPAVFEEQIKLGALTACCGAVLWKDDVTDGRVAFETVDPRFVWFDHTFRNLYRIRRIEIDRHEINTMMKASDGKNPIFNKDELMRLQSSISVEDEQWRASMSGHGHETSSNRRPVVLEEYIATVVAKDGSLLAENALIVVADRKHIIRGPEKNPFWHGQDWLVYAPLITAPLSVYGRSYMEDFGSLSDTFTELTNLILDAAYTSALNAFVLVPSMLMNPDQAAEGVHPNKAFLLDEGFNAGDFAKALDLGTIDPGAVQVWQTLKGELSEAAAINELGLGQFAPKGRTSATEVNTVQSNSSALVRSIAQTVETRFLDIVLDLTWKTGLQHVKKGDARMARVAGKEMWGALMGSRKELIKRPITFQAQGISALIQRSQMLQSLLQALQIIGQSEQLIAAFAQQVDFPKLVKLLFELSNIDPTRFTKSERQLQIDGIAQQTNAAAGGAQPTEAGNSAVGGLLQNAGVAR